MNFADDIVLIHRNDITVIINSDLNNKYENSLSSSHSA